MMSTVVIRFFVFIFLFCIFYYSKAQSDSISLRIRLDEDSRVMMVNQRIVYHNKLSRSVDSIKLLSWANAYRNQRTPLSKRKLQERNTGMHFTNRQKRGYVERLSLDFSDVISHSSERGENIYIYLKNPLESGENLTLNLKYTLRIPSADFTGYGYGGDNILLKYFFLVPDGFEDNKLSRKFYLDLDENQNSNVYWDIQFEKFPYFLQSNLIQKDLYSFEGILHQDPEIQISYKENTKLDFNVEGQKITLELGYKATSEEEMDLAFLVPKQLKFIKERVGFLPSKIFISQRDGSRNKFTGIINDVKFLKWKFFIYSSTQRTDLNYFSIISQNIVNQSFFADKNKNHWIYNGLKTYLEMQYLKQYYPDEKILGNLTEDIKLWNIKPLEWFEASKLKLSDKYSIFYGYVHGQNLDQKISTKLQDLGKNNYIAISNFETGMIFNMISEKTKMFDSFIAKFLSDNKGKEVDSKKFLDELDNYTSHETEFLEKFIENKNRINFKLHSFKKKDDSLEIKVSKNTPLKIPFRVETEGIDGNRDLYWFDTDKSTIRQVYKIPDPNNRVKKISVNKYYIFPESNIRDNFLYSLGIFSNMKKLKIKFFTDIPNPEYNEIYLTPNAVWNNYDNFLFGMRFTNSSLLERKFKYSLTPYYSTGMGKFTGEAGSSYNFMPSEAFFRSLTIGANTAYFHYDYNLPYKKLNVYTRLNFSKVPRSQISRSVGFSYNYLEKELSPSLIAQNSYGKYNLWNISYNYIDNQAIHRNYFFANFQWMEDFKKISTEYYYRWEYEKDKKFLFRTFAGIFLDNNTRNNLFNFGVYKSSNYAFNTQLLGQSAISGILFQQFVLAEVGFKTFFNGNYINQWVVSTNIDNHLWKMFNVYADAGFYKNRSHGAKFIWDSGIKLKIVPDFIEIYFPLHSSIGFEPLFSDYGYRIRYSLNLTINSLISYIGKIGKFY